MVIGLISAAEQATTLRRASASSAAPLPHGGTGPERPGAGENGALDPALQALPQHRANRAEQALLNPHGLYGALAMTGIHVFAHSPEHVDLDGFAWSMS